MDHQHLDRHLAGEENVDVEDDLGVAFPSFVTFLFIGICLYGLMLVLLMFAHGTRRAQEIAIRNDDDARDVRFKRRKREGLSDDFFLQYGYSFDWVFVFQVRNEWDVLDDFQKEYSMKRVLSLLALAGLETSQFYSVQRDEVYCKIRCPLDRLVAQADAIDFKLLLDPVEAEKEMKHGRRAHAIGRKGPNTVLWKGRVIEDQFAQSPYGVFDYIYGKYNMAPPVPGKIIEGSMYPKLYIKHELECDVISEFSSVDRIKIMKTIFEGSRNEKCCGMNLSQLVANEAIISAFPLHNPKEKVLLEKKWLRAHQYPWNQPLWDVKCYYGEKVALFFGFLGHINSWLIVSGLLGLAVYIDMAATSSYTVASQFYFGIFLAIWSTLLLEFWKRRESTLVMMWGMEGFEEEEEDRPEYTGEEIPSPVDGEEVLYFPQNEVLKAISKSLAILGCIVVVLLGIFASIFALGAFLNMDIAVHEDLSTEFIDFGQFIPSMLCALVILFCSSSGLFDMVATTLTDMENHRTDTMYEDALIGKTFIFEFFNSYSACFYVLFLKQYSFEDACTHGCIRDLHYLLGCIFFTIIIVHNVLQVYTPTIASKRREAEEREGADPTKPFSNIEKQFMLENYEDKGSFDQFKDIFIQFGYSVIFSAAFPLAPLLSFVSTYFEIRVDAWYLLQKTRRVIPTGVEDIGTWQSVFEAIAACSVIVNMGIIFTVSQLNDNTSWIWRILYFLMLEHAIFCFQYFFAVLVDDVPAETVLQLERQAFLVEKLIDNMEDNDVEGMVHDQDDDDTALDFIDDIYDDDEDPVL